jgi:lysophospholipase L1-like esterase
MKSSVFKIAIMTTLCSSGIFLACLIAEAYLGFSGYSYSPLKIEDPRRKIDGLGRVDWRTHNEKEDDFFIADAFLLWRPKKNYKNFFNSMGLRGPEIKKRKGKDDYYIFALGDSNTLGQRDNPGWVEYLNEIMTEKRPGARVINAGVWGYSSLQVLERLKEVMRYEPDAVLISCCSNDARMVTISDREYMGSKRRLKSPVSALKISQLFFALSDRLLMKRRGSDLIPRVSLREYSSNLEDMLSLVKKNRVDVILITRPFIGKPAHPLEYRNFCRNYNEITKEIADKHRIPLVDFYSFFENRKRSFADDCHFSEEGHKLASGIIADTLLGNSCFNSAIQNNKPVKEYAAGFNVINSYKDGHIIFILQITNEGEVVWTRKKPDWIRAGCRIYQEDRQNTGPFLELRQELPREDIKSKETFQVEFIVDKNVLKNGVNILRFDMVNENKFWFEDAGSSPVVKEFLNK